MYYLEVQSEKSRVVRDQVREFDRGVFGQFRCFGFNFVGSYGRVLSLEGKYDFGVGYRLEGKSEEV